MPNTANLPTAQALLTNDRPAARAKEAYWPLDRVQVGDRHRRDLGDVDSLARSMAELGLLHPIVIRPDGTLIAGERRLRAAQSLGWQTIPVTVLDLDAVVRGEFAENAVRKDFTLSEAVAIKRALEPIERAAAKQRMASPEKFSEHDKGNALDKVATIVRKHRTTLAKAEAIVDAAEAEPERFGKLLADMDRTGRAHGVFKRLRVIRQGEQIRAEPPPLPGRGPYRVATIDVPWPYEASDEDPSHRAVLPYATMSIPQICAFPLPSILHENAIVGMWTTNFFIVRHAQLVLDAWGLTERTIITWGKDHFGYGDKLRGQTEHCILATRGKPIFTCTNQSTLLLAPAPRGHSRKPPEFYDLIESLCPAPRYADLFSRYRHNERWDCHGDELPADAEVRS